MLVPVAALPGSGVRFRRIRSCPGLIHGSGLKACLRTNDQPPPQWPQVAPPQQPSGPRPGGQEPSGPGWGESSLATPPIGWNYVEGIRASELVPSRKIPPGRGWRRLIYNATGGLVNLGQSPDELQQAHLEARIRTLLRGQYKIGVLGKGGVGKTTVAACVGSIFAELRQDDRVVAIDADTAFGELGARVDPHGVGSYLGPGRRRAPRQIRRCAQPGRKQRCRAVRAGR